MSCVSFLSPRQRAMLRTSSAAGAPLSSFVSPEVTEGKIERLRQLALNADPKIRESAALAYATPTEVLAVLAADPQVSVRFSVARNERTPPEVLTVLAADESAGVRGWVAANPAVPPGVLEALADDPDATVRGVVTWARQWPDASKRESSRRSNARSLG